MAEPISAYDLARDIAKEIVAEPELLSIIYDSDGPWPVLDHSAAIAVIERMIVAALKNGGIRA